MVITDETVQLARTPSERGLGGQFDGCSGSGRRSSSSPLSRWSWSSSVRDLVNRGLVPAATVDDGTQISSRSLEP